MKILNSLLARIAQCSLRAILVLPFVAVIMMFAFARPVLAATITVDTVADNDGVNGTCTLREALIAARYDAPEDNCVAGDTSTDTIDLTGLTGTITLAETTAALDVISEAVGGPITISGPGPGNLTIDATGNSSGVFRFDTVAASETFTLSAVTVTGGNIVAACGGGLVINANVTLNLNDSVIEGNTSSCGGGIYSSTNSVLNITNSIIQTNNSAGGIGGSGGGIEVASGVLHLLNSTVDSNSAPSNTGGGIDISGPSPATSTVVNSTISNNSSGAGGGGGGISVSVADISIDKSTISGNSSVADGGG